MELESRVERLLGLLLLLQVQDKPQAEKIKWLNRAGFSNLEVADLLETTPAVVAQTLYEERRRAKAPRSRKPKKAKLPKK